MVEKWRERSTYGKSLYNKILKLKRRFQKENNLDNEKKHGDKVKTVDIDKLNSLAAKIGYLIQIALQNLSAIEEQEAIEELKKIKNDSEKTTEERTRKEELTPNDLRG